METYSQKTLRNTSGEQQKNLTNNENLHEIGPTLAIRPASPLRTIDIPSHAAPIMQLSPLVLGDFKRWMTG